MNEKQTLVSLIRAARLKRHLTQFELSALMGYQYNIMATLESKGQHKRIYRDDWDRIVAVLGDDLDLAAAAPLVVDLPEAGERQPRQPIASKVVDGIGERLLRLRKSFGLSQQDVADELKISKAQVSRVEQGSFLPAITHLQVLVKLYDTSYDYLIDGVGEMRNEK